MEKNSILYCDKKELSRKESEPFVDVKLFQAGISSDSRFDASVDDGLKISALPNLVITATATNEKAAVALNDLDEKFVITVHEGSCSRQLDKGWRAKRTLSAIREFFG